MKKQLIFVLAIATLSLTGCEEDYVNPPFINVMDSEHARVTTINSFYPESGAAGIVVTIFGENFGGSISENKVTFSGINSEVLQVQRGKITVRVPLNLAQGDYQITLSALSQTVTSAQAFKVKGVEKKI